MAQAKRHSYGGARCKPLAHARTKREIAVRGGAWADVVFHVGATRTTLTHHGVSKWIGVDVYLPRSNEQVHLAGMDPRGGVGNREGRDGPLVREGKAPGTCLNRQKDTVTSERGNELAYWTVVKR
jgi:hypothetical protein